VDAGGRRAEVKTGSKALVEVEASGEALAEVDASDGRASGRAR
jgi:hypothetical protein